MNRRQLLTQVLEAAGVVRGGVVFPFSQDFSAISGLGGWTIPGTAQVTGGALVITPTLGVSDLLTNGNMETGDPPSTWGYSFTSGASVANERTGGAGTKALSMVNSGAASAIGLQAMVHAIHAWLHFDSWGKRVTNASPIIRLRSGSTNVFQKTNSSTSWNNIIFAARAIAANTSAWLLNSTAIQNDEARFDDISVKVITLSTMGIYRQKTGTSWRIIVLPSTGFAGMPFGGWLVVDTPSNPLNGYLIYHDGVSLLHFEKHLNGVVTDIIAPVTVAYNAASAVQARINGTTVQAFYGAAQQGADTIVLDDAAITGQYCGVFSAGAESTIKTFELTTNP